MANITKARPGAGQTRLGTTRTGAVDSDVVSQSPIGTASTVAFQDTAGETWFLWVDESGVLRIGAARPVGADAQSTGAIVGTQT